LFVSPPSSRGIIIAVGLDECDNLADFAGKEIPEKYP